MKKYIPILVFCLFIAAILVQCKKDNPVQLNNPPADSSGDGGNTDVSYNKADTTVSLQNGRLTLDIPAGAMKEGTEVSIGNSNIDFIDTSILLHQFQLLPEGTKFKKPATLTFHYDSTWLKGNSPWNIGIAFRNDNDNKWYSVTGGAVDTINHTISVPIWHFSHWTIYNCFHLYMRYNADISEDNSHTILMKPGDKAYLLLSMVAPPAWVEAYGEEYYLIAPLVPPKIKPKEDYSSSLDPDQWTVNGIMNGNATIGTISSLDYKLYQYTAPADPPKNQPVAITALVRTKSHGWIYLIQDVQIGKYGYLPSSDISRLTYVINPGNVKTFVDIEVTGNDDQATALMNSSFVVLGQTMTSKAISSYDGQQTVIKSWPSNKEYESYNKLRKSNFKTPGVIYSNVDTSFSGFPISYVIKDQASAGNNFSFKGSKTTHMEYNETVAGSNGTIHYYFSQKAYNRNGLVIGFDSVTTKAGSFYCLKIKYDYVVADTETITPSGSAGQIKKETVFNNTMWMARGIGLIKTSTYDPTNGTTSISELTTIERKN